MYRFFYFFLALCCFYNTICCLFIRFSHETKTQMKPFFEQKLWYILCGSTMKCAWILCKIKRADCVRIFMCYRTSLCSLLISYNVKSRRYESSLLYISHRNEINSAWNHNHSNDSIEIEKKIYYLTYRIMWTRWEFSNESNSVNFVFVFSFFSLFVSIKIGLTERTATKALKNFTLFFLSSFLILNSFRHFALSRPISHFTSHFDQ